MSNTRRGRFLLAAVLVAVVPPATLAAQARGVTGSYELLAAGGRRLPVMVSRIIPGEGTTLHSARLELLPDGRLDGAIVVSVTDSGTVSDTVVARGRWRVDGDTIRVTYEWSRPRWQGGSRVFEAGRPVSAAITGAELTLPELAFFNDRFFGGPARLRFRRLQ